MGEERSSSSPSSTFYPERIENIDPKRKEWVKGTAHLGRGIVYNRRLAVLKSYRCMKSYRSCTQESIYCKSETVMRNARYVLWKSFLDKHRNNSNMFHVHSFAQTSLSSSKTVEMSSFKIPRAIIPWWYVQSGRLKRLSMTHLYLG